jgi:lysophospholipase L1-like esterase
MGVDDAGQPPSLRHYLALGSSSTAGSGASQPASTAYVPQIHARLKTHSPDLALHNEGQGGIRIGTYLGRVDELAGIGADVVTVLPFTDYVRTPVGDFSSGYGQLLDALVERGATVFFGDLRVDPDLVCGQGEGPGGCYEPDDQALLDEKNRALAELAAARPQVIIVPVFDQNVAHPEYNATDGHPNDAGHAYLADAFWEVMESWVIEPG